MKKKLLLVIPFILLVIGFSIYVVQRRSTNSPTAIQSSTKSQYTIKKDITYCSPEGSPQLLDLYSPQDGAIKHPLIIHVHGGSWVSGAKSDDSMIDVITSLAEKGFAVASINYRLAPNSKFPAQIQDVKCAIRFMRSNANTYKVNPGKIGLLGESAGGHLSALAGVSQNVSDFESSEYAGVSDSVSVIVDLFGPANLVSFTQGSPLLLTALPSFLGSYSPIAASPTSYIDASDPPFLLIHGDSDTLVPLAQSQELLAKLQSAGVESSLITVVNAGHGLELSRGDAISPSMDQIKASAVSFFKSHL
ncbi:MAG: alpha/beta hydrolase [Candidatus Saccharibacteria bacterium]